MSTVKTTTSAKKRKGMIRRGVSDETISNVANQVSAAETAVTKDHEIKYVSLSNIRLWDDQPRKMALTLDDVIAGEINNDDPERIQKQEELEEIIDFALSIKSEGLLNPPLSYALPAKMVQLIGGQRRIMASVFSIFHISKKMGVGEQEEYIVEIDSQPDTSLLEVNRIEIKVLPRKPDDLTIDRLSMLDNAQRKDLSTSEKLHWVINHADKCQALGRKLGFRDFVEILGLNRSQSYEWVKVVDARKDEWVAKVIQSVIKGKQPMKRAIEIASAEPAQREELYKSWFEKSPAPDKTGVKLGEWNNLKALKTLVLNNIAPDDRDIYSAIDWTNPKSAKQGFTKFMKYWVEKYG